MLACVKLGVSNATEIQPNRVQPDRVALVNSHFTNNYEKNSYIEEPMPSPWRRESSGIYAEVLYHLNITTRLHKDYHLIIIIDRLVKSRHPGESRGPGQA